MEQKNNAVNKISEMLGIPTSVESAEKMIREDPSAMSRINTAAYIAYLLEEVSKLTDRPGEYVSEKFKLYQEECIKREAKALYEHWQNIGKEDK